MYRVLELTKSRFAPKAKALALGSIFIVGMSVRGVALAQNVGVLNELHRQLAADQIREKLFKKYVSIGVTTGRIAIETMMSLGYRCGVRTESPLVQEMRLIANDPVVPAIISCRSYDPSIDLHCREVVARFELQWRDSVPSPDKLVDELGRSHVSAVSALCWDSHPVSVSKERLMRGDDVVSLDTEAQEIEAGNPVLARVLDALWRLQFECGLESGVHKSNALLDCIKVPAKNPNCFMPRVQFVIEKSGRLTMKQIVGQFRRLRIGLRRATCTDLSGILTH